MDWIPYQHSMLLNPSDEFIDEELYVFILEVVNDTSTLMTAHGASESLIGQEVHNLTGEHGKLSVQELIEVSSGVEGKGWGWYYWVDATDNDLVKKKFSYVVRVGEYIVGSGTYLD